MFHENGRKREEIRLTLPYKVTLNLWKSFLDKAHTNEKISRATFQLLSRNLAKSHFFSVLRKTPSLEQWTLEFKMFWFDFLSTFETFFQNIWNRTWLPVCITWPCRTVLSKMLSNFLLPKQSWDFFINLIMRQTTDKILPRPKRVPLYSALDAHWNHFPRYQKFLSACSLGL